MDQYIRLVELWQRGATSLYISDDLGWSHAKVQLTLRQLRLLGVQLRPAPVPSGEHELELAALARLVDIDRLKEVAIEARGSG